MGFCNETGRAPGKIGRATRRRDMVMVLTVGLLSASLSTGALAEAALEYGPEVEARFLERCIEAGEPANACQGLMERLQARFGYGEFVAMASDAADGGRMVAESRLAIAGAMTEAR